jgi:hypothetical protein
LTYFFATIMIDALALQFARRDDRILLVWSHTLLSNPSGFFLDIP